MQCHKALIGFVALAGLATQVRAEAPQPYPPPSPDDTPALLTVSSAAERRRLAIECRAMPADAGPQKRVHCVFRQSQLEGPKSEAEAEEVARRAGAAMREMFRRSPADFWDTMERLARDAQTVTARRLAPHVRTRDLKALVHELEAQRRAAALETCIVHTSAFEVNFERRHANLWEGVRAPEPGGPARAVILWREPGRSWAAGNYRETQLRVPRDGGDGSDSRDGGGAAATSTPRDFASSVGASYDANCRIIVLD